MPAKLHQVVPSFAFAVGGGVLPAVGMPFLLALTVGDGVTGDLDWTGIPGLTFRITGAWTQKTTGPGGVGDTLQLQSATGVPVTNAMDVNVAAGVLVRATTIDDLNAAQVVPTGFGLRVRRVNGAAGGNVLNATVYVEAVRL